MDKKMLQEVLKAYGPSGREEKVAEVIKGYVAPYADTVYTDAMGNLIALKKGKSGKRVMLAAHMDQIGFIVTAIDDKGFLRVSNVGGINPNISVSREVAFENGTHGIMFRDTKDVKDVTMTKLFVDIGASSLEEAEKKVSIGDVCCYVSNYVEMGERAASGAMDDRVACAVLIETMKKMKSEHDVYCVFTVQEEVGLRGAGTAAYAIDPSLAIACDVTGVGDIPECEMMTVALGSGATVKIMDSSVIVPVPVRDFMEKAGKKANVRFQREVLRAGGTDTGAIQRSRGGVLAGCISIPTRYIHSPVETVDMNDVESAVDLMCACLGEKELPTR